jgi:hypothetical protein
MNNKIFINYTYNLDFLIEDEIQIEADYVKEYDNLNTLSQTYIEPILDNTKLDNIRTLLLSLSTK